MLLVRGKIYARKPLRFLITKITDFMWLTAGIHLKQDKITDAIF